MRVFSKLIVYDFPMTFSGLNLFSINEFVTTLTDENAIAAAAMMGFRNPNCPSANTRVTGTMIPRAPKNK